MMFATDAATNLPVILLAADNTKVLRHLGKLLMPSFTVRVASDWEPSPCAQPRTRPLPKLVLVDLPYDPARLAVLTAALPGLYLSWKTHFHCILPVCVAALRYQRAMPRVLSRSLPLSVAVP